MAEPVGHEEAVGTGGDDVVGVAAEDAEAFVAFGEDAAGGLVDFLVGDAGTGDAYGFEVGGEDDFVDGFLALVEAAAHGDGAGDVGAVVHGGFATGVHDEHASFLEAVVVSVVVEGLAVDGHDDGEGDGAVAFPGFAFHESGEFVFVAAGHGEAHGADVHVVGCGDGAFDFGNLLGALDGALLDAGEDEVERGVAVDGGVGDAEPLAEVGADVGAVGRQVVGQGGGGTLAVEVFAEVGKGAAVVDADAGGEFLDGGQGAGPDDVVDVVVVGEEVVLAAVAVDDAHEVFALEAEEVEEGAVLAEPVGVVLVVAGCLVVAGEDDDAALEVLAELLAAGDIGLFVEHGGYVFYCLYACVKTEVVTRARGI